MDLIQTLEQEEIVRLNKTIPVFAPGDTVIVSVMTTTGVCVGVGVCVAAAVTDADAPLVVLAVGAGDVVTEAAGVGVGGAVMEKTVLGDAMESSSHVPRRSYGQYSAGLSPAAVVATVDMPNTRCTVSAAVSTA